VDVQLRCEELKERVGSELQVTHNPDERAEILIAALYEFSRKVLPALGHPRKSQDYLESQGAVLELVSFIAIHLIRNCAQQSRGVAVFAEIGEGCHDPLLKKKLSVYAQQLLAKKRSGIPDQGREPNRRIPVLLGLAVAAVFALYLTLPAPDASRIAAAPVTEQSLRAPGTLPLAYQAATIKEVPAVPAATPAENPRERNEAPQEPAPEGKGAPPGEQVTKVRITNNQVLVPVTLKNGGESVRVELVLDTGCTRTSIHEGLASRLRIDLRGAKTSQSELADGRLVRSRVATLESLGVGPFTMNPAEVDLLPYKGSEGVHDGLLGMDFLGKHRYQIDMEREQIRWF
jgi:hypothetical protein